MNWRSYPPLAKLVPSPRHAWSACGGIGPVCTLLLAGVLAGTLNLAWPAHADPASRDRLKSIETEMREAKAREAALAAEAKRIAQERDALERRVAETARALREQERKVGDTETRLTALAVEAEAAEADLESRRAALERTLSGLVHTARMPQGIAALGAGSPVETHRAALLLGGASTELEAAARALRISVERLAVAREGLSRQRETLAGSLATLGDRRAALQASLGEREKAGLATQEARKAEAERLKGLAADARDVRQLIEKAEAEERRRAQEAEAKARAEAQARAREQARAQAEAKASADAKASVEARARAEAAKQVQIPAPPAPEPAPPEPRIASLPPPEMAPPPSSPDTASLLLPTRGRVVARFGDPMDAGQTQKGVRLTTAPGSTVFSPSDGKVIFAGPFRGYGPLLILSCRDGYHLLIAGFGRIEASAGQSVVRGDPIGFMSEEPGGDTLLYVELRRKGEPVNPLPWLAQAERKVDG